MDILRNALFSVAALVAIMVVAAPRASAQDPGAAAAQAAQQAAMQATQINQQQIQQMQEQNARLSTQIQEQMAEASNAAQTNGPYCCRGTLPPTFSAKPGKYSQALQVRILDRTRAATIYYTTDGWTPTLKSAKYDGPITIDSTTELQAIAVGPSPFFARSLVAKARYDVNAPTASANTAASAPSGVITAQNGTLPKGLAIPLVFAKGVSSKTAYVGDKIELKLANDITDGSAVLVAKGAPAFGIVTEVDQTGLAGAPGNIEFRITSLNAGGQTIPLRGSAAREGDAKPPNATVLVPVAGVFAILRHGKDAEIAVGTSITAHVAADTPLRPQ